MNVKGMPPISVENVPDGQVMLQMAFRHGDTVHNINLIGPIDAMIASSKLRDMIIRKGFLNVGFLNASGVTGIKLDAGVEDLELAKPGEIENIAEPAKSSLVKLS